jgi:hypothetical protein
MGSVWGCGARQPAVVDVGDDGWALSKWDRQPDNFVTSRKATGAIPDEVSGFSNLPNPSGRSRPWSPLSL